MSYNLKIHYAPIHELLLSFLLYKRPERIKYLEVGADWTSRTQKMLSTKLSNQIDQLEDLSFFDLSVLLMEESDPDESIESYLQRVASYSPGQLYERIMPYIMPTKSIPHDLGKERDIYINIIEGWNLDYFSHLDPNIFNRLKQKFNYLLELKDSTNVRELVDRFSNGLIIDSSIIKEVILIPAHHFRPLTTYSILNGKAFILFPLELDTKTRLINCAKAIGDERRINILQLLNKGKFTFSDIVKEIGSGKGNIHHHITILRSNGLIRTHIGEDCSTNFTYSLREEPLREWFNDFNFIINRN
ncbi:ArsR/SmtB family transcription factor [Fredinandcohnia humi]